MRYHNITKDDMKNGDGRERYYGLQAVPTVVRAATIRSHGMRMAGWSLMGLQKRRFLTSWKNLISPV